MARVNAWNMFIDDERFPPDDGKTWIVCRNYDDVMARIKERNFMPSYISFDHDLGENTPDGMVIVKAIVMMDMIARDAGDVRRMLPPDFSYYVHSRNCIGAENIEHYLKGYLKFIGAEK